MSKNEISFCSFIFDQKLEAIRIHMLSCAVFRQLIIFLSIVSTWHCASSLWRGQAENAKQLYDIAMQDFADGMFQEAITGFTELKTKFPYSKYAIIADLRIGDTNFERGKHLEAVDSFRTFLKYHPSHSDAAYAMFKIGEAYYEQIPTDWWFLPPSREKDQKSTHLAIAALRELIDRFPKASESKRGRKLLDECRRKLADHEIYVARFYFERKKYQSAALRCEKIIQEYTGLGLDLEALWTMAQSWYAIDKKEKAYKILNKILKDFPDTSEAKQASILLRDINIHKPVVLPKATSPKG